MIDRNFLTARKAVFRVTVPPGAGFLQPDFIYKVKYQAPQARWRDATYFVQLYLGPTVGFKYLGMMDPRTGQLRLTAKSCRGLDSDEVRLFNRLCYRVWGGTTEAFTNAGFTAEPCENPMLPATAAKAPPADDSDLVGSRLGSGAYREDADYTKAIQAQERAEEEARCRYKMERDAAAMNGAPADDVPF